jgi:hypothetical protein
MQYSALDGGSLLFSALVEGLMGVCGREIAAPQDAAAAKG